jgi:hypothetical protein
MPRLIPKQLAAACVLALIIAVCVVAPAAAKGPVASLRVVNTSGKTLAEDSFGAMTASTKASPQATCFGAGTGGSGKTVTVKGPTALGMLIQASAFTKTLKPLLITDHFSFGLGLCGVGGFSVHGEGSWYLKINHKSSQIGGDKAKVGAGDEVLWYLASTFPYPNELVLSAPATAKAGVPFKVQVFSYDEKGKKKPAAGVKVNGAKAKTGSDGRTTVTLNKSAKLFASDGTDIPSARESVCVASKQVKCKGSGSSS